MKRVLVVLGTALVPLALHAEVTALAAEVAAESPASGSASGSASVSASAAGSGSPSASTSSSGDASASASSSPSASASSSVVNPIAAYGVVPRAPMLRRANTWDGNLEIGYGDVFGDPKKGSALFRGRFGAMFIRDNDFWQVGATAEYTNALGRPAFGLQVEYLHLEMGTWIQLGSALDTKGRPGGMAAVGVSLFGIEATVRPYDDPTDPTFALFGKIRIPIGIIVYALRDRH